MAKIVVDKKLCIGCGLCASLCPNTFRIGRDGKSEAFDQKGDSKESVDRAIASCPVKAISRK